MIERHHGTERILEISKIDGNSHIGSSIGIYQTMKEAEKVMREGDRVVLDGAHGSLGYFVWLEETRGEDAHELHQRHGTHQHREPESGIEVSGGSLGLAASIALGMAMSDPIHNYYVITTDGSLAEGVWWEVLRVKADHQVDNLKVYVSANGFSAYDPVDVDTLERRVHAFCDDVVFVRTNTDFNDIQGLDAHYKPLR